MGSRKPDGFVQKGGRPILRQHGRPSRQLRPLEFQAPEVERRQHGAGARHRRRVAEGRKKRGPALRRLRTPRRSFTWFQTSHGADKTGPKAGVPYDGADPKYADLYHWPRRTRRHRSGTGPTRQWHQQWFDRISDLVDSYQPDLLYSDGGLPFGRYGRTLLANFYNAHRDTAPPRPFTNARATTWMAKPTSLSMKAAFTTSSAAY